MVSIPASLLTTSPWPTCLPNPTFHPGKCVGWNSLLPTNSPLSTGLGLKWLCLMLLASSTLLFLNLAGWHVSPTNSTLIRTSPLLLHVLATMMVIFICMVRVITQPSTGCCMLRNCWYCLLWVVFMKFSLASCMTAPLVAIWALRKHRLLCSNGCGSHTWKLAWMLMWLAAPPASMSMTALPTLQAFFSHWNHPPHGLVTTL